MRRAAAASLAAACAAASAQTPSLPSPSPLGVAVEAAWQRAVAETEAEGQSLRAEAVGSVARSAFPAPPWVELAHRDGRPGMRASGTGRETEAALALPLWLPGQRGARLALADAEDELAAARRAHGRWTVAGQVREAAWSMHAARADVAQAGARHDALLRLAEDVDRRVASGDLARADALAAHAEVRAAEAALADAVLRRHDAWRRWRLLTGLDGEPPDAPLEADAGEASSAPAAPLALATSSAPLAPLVPSVPSALSTTPPVPPEHPELRLARSAVEQARRQWAGVRATARPSPELLLRYRQETGGAAAARDSLGVGVRFALGTDVRNRLSEAQAAAVLLVAERHWARAQDGVAAGLAEARQALAAADTRLHAQTQRAALLRERAELVRRAFAAGEFGLPETLRVVAADAEARLDLERARAMHGLARARLAQSQGITP